TRLTEAEIEFRRKTIYQEILEESRCVKRGNFTGIETADLRLLFKKYDVIYFGRKCEELTSSPNSLRFRLSKRMTSAAGKTYQRRPRHLQTRAADYEIAISTTLLLETFNEEMRPITVSGVLCVDRLEALQRIFEHEMLHLIEMLVWDHSSCSADRFREMAHRLFGHLQNTHQLITPREIAQKKYGIQPGQRVKFTFEGRRYFGVVNRVTKRATVLVPDANGERYSDGKCYLKFYIPLPMLTPVGDEEIER
ncbi:MAG: hypothetical protein KDA84_08345, partial [Planctomycetaceae bacterium]|nr:hypothetical protein [Planctomycetaceae bacterium]